MNGAAVSMVAIWFASEYHYVPTKLHKLLGEERSKIAAASCENGLVSIHT
jgi:hypothetical protein